LVWTFYDRSDYPIGAIPEGQVNCKKIDCTKSKPIFNFLKKENFVRGIDLKIDDIWVLDLFMTGHCGKRFDYNQAFDSGTGYAGSRQSENI